MAQPQAQPQAPGAAAAAYGMYGAAQPQQGPAAQVGFGAAQYGGVQAAPQYMYMQHPQTGAVYMVPAAGVASGAGVPGGALQPQQQQQMAAMQQMQAMQQQQMMMYGMAQGNAAATAAMPAVGGFAAGTSPSAAPATAAPQHTALDDLAVFK